MVCCPELRRWLSLSGTLAVLTIVAVVIYFNNGAPATVEGQPTVQPTGQPAAQPTAGTTWPLWGGSISRNLVNTTDRNIPDEWECEGAKPKNLLWVAQLGSKAYGGPTIHGGRIFMGTNNGKPRDAKIEGDKGVMMAFDEATGKFLWQLVFDKLAASRVQDWPEEGICSGPVADGDKIYFVCNRCEVICANAADGKILWRLDMIAKLGVFPHNLATCSPLIVGDSLFVITSNGVNENHLDIPAPTAPSFLALDKKDGTVLWSSNLPSINLISARKENPTITLKELVDRGLVLMHGQWSNPVYTEAGRPQIIFPGGDGWLYSFNPKTGELLWKYDCNPKSSFYLLGGKGTRNDFVCTPVVAGNYLYIGVGQDPEHKKGVGHLWCIDVTKVPAKADKDLTPPNDPKDTNPAYDPKDPKNKDSGLVWHYGGDAPPGSKRRYLFGRTMSTCAIHEGLCYAGDYDGYVFCFDAKTGQKYWEHDMGQDNWSSPSYVDGKIYIGNEGGTVLIFKAGKMKNDPKEVQMAGDAPQVRTTPLVANGVLYVLSENPTKLYAIGKK